MITGYDPSTSTLTIGIGDLLALRRLPDTLVPSGNTLDVHRRQRAHSAFQKRMVKMGWTAEVPLEFKVQRGGVTFHVRGRADLLRGSAGPEGQLVELVEVKTLHSPPAFTDPLLARSRDVLQLYAYSLALAAARPGEPHVLPEGRLIYLPIGPEGGEPVEFIVDLKGEVLNAAWEELLDGTAAWLISEDLRRGAQLAALQTVRFPYDDFRPGQLEMTEAVDECLALKGRLLLQAPTGTGKTAAVLSGALGVSIPQMLSLFFLTAKNTHKMMVRETVELLMKRGLNLRTIILTARQTLCARNRSTCFPDDCQYAPDFGRRVRESGVMDGLLSGGVIGPEELREQAIAAGVCPFELGLCLSTECDVICGDYNYVFDPHVFLKRFFMEPSTSSMCSLLIDEAANLPSRAVSYYSPGIRLTWLTELLSERLPRGTRKLLKDWTTAFGEWDRLLDIEGSVELELPNETVLPIAIDSWLRIMEKVRDPSRLLLDLYRSLIDFSRIGPEPDGRYHLIFVREGGDRLLQWYCTDPSEYLAERMDSCHSVVAFSATLSPPDHFLRMLGLDRGGAEPSVKALSYPFPKANLGVWIDRSVDTRYRQRRSSAPLLARNLTSLHRASPGSWLVFLPSFAYLRLVEGHLAGDHPPVLCQQRQMSAEDREDFIGEISRGDYLVLIVSGGIFSEGVDLRSGNLRGAVVVGPSLPGMDLRARLLSESFAERGLDGFLHTWAIPGMTRVVQAAGRLIRNPDQRRMLVLMGKRFCSSPYFDMLPAHWFSDGSIPLLSEEMKEIESFNREQ